MTNRFREVRPEDLALNPFEAIGEQWMLIAAEREGAVNAMTASWGGLGVIWGRNVAYAVIRPQRFTKEFVDAAEDFSLSFFGREHKKTLGYLGRVSGRDEDKISKSGLTLLTGGRAPYFAESGLTLFCRKLFAQPLDPGSFTAAGGALDGEFYPEKDYHTLYIGEITRVLQEIR